MAVLYRVCFYGADSRLLPTLAAYVVLVLFQYAMLRAFAEKSGWLPWLAFFTPILALVLVRYGPASVSQSPLLPYGPFFLVISYLALRRPKSTTRA